MADSCNKEKPRLVVSGQGFSVLNTVEYKGRFLYSKYNPSRAIESIIEKTVILEGSLIVISSPALWYGYDTLQKKIKENCTIIAIEFDEELYALAEENMPENFPKGNLFSLKNLLKIDQFVRNICSSGKTKRVINIDFSAGVNFDKKNYDFVLNGVQDIIGSFWKNRITLVKFGKLFSKNFLSNIKKTDKNLLLEEIVSSISRPIVVCGAGESLDSFDFSQAEKNGAYILCVDAALTSLLERGIKVDAVVAMESQFAICKAYIGSRTKNMTLFADLCSRPDIIDFFNGKKIFFASRYAEGSFFEKLKKEKIISSFMEPMGSVGLAAVEIALKIRKDSSVPVYITGLDFSYSVGKTHAKTTMAHKSRLINLNRTVTADNIDAAYSQSTLFAEGINGEKICTSRIMMIYANQFVQMFSRKKNLFDSRNFGLPLNLERKNPSAQDSNFYSNDESFPESKEIRKAFSFIQNEKTNLLTAKDLLVNGEKSEFRDKNISLHEQIKNILEHREYLFLHFPDGFYLRMDDDFLKRVRAEIDVFLKCMS